jgi:glucose 1-dehydrogenase
MNESLMRLKNKVALITGAAQGIGKSIAEVYAHEGAAVVIADIQDGKATAKSFERGSFIRTDLTNDSDIERMINFAVKEYGALDILINNAAPSRNQSNSSDEMVKDWDASMDVLLRAHVVAAKCARTYLKRIEGGSIINIGSIVDSTITHQSCAYHVAKAGIAHLTRYLAWEFGPDGIRVNCICPGLVDRAEGKSLTRDPVNSAVIDLSVPLKRAGSQNDIAYSALFLCTEEASYITGQSLVVDGGVTLGETFGVAREAYRAVLK